jgi:hypothetical protein
MRMIHKLAQLYTAQIQATANTYLQAHSTNVNALPKHTYFDSDLY